MTHGLLWLPPLCTSWKTPSTPEFVADLDHAFTNMKYNPADGLLYGMERGYV